MCLSDMLVIYVYLHEYCCSFFGLFLQTTRAKLHMFVRPRQAHPTSRRTRYTYVHIHTITTILYALTTSRS